MKKSLLILPLIGMSLFLAGCGPREPSKYDTFATCLAENGAKMYGTEWCPHCKNQKELFGESFDKVDYIDCDLYRTKCKQAGVEGYPTWIFNDDTRVAGTQPLEELAKKANCPLLIP